MTKKILIIEDNPLTVNALQNEISKYDLLEGIIAQTYQDAVKILRRSRKEIDFAIIDLSLPDADGKKIVALMNSHHIPSIIFTGTEEAEIRNLVFQKNVIDYILKDNQNSLSYIIKRVHRFLKCHEHVVLIVDDSALYRDVIKEALEPLNLTILETDNGIEALNLIHNEKNNIKIVITDYHMPKMDGMELVMKIRSTHNREQISIIASSTTNDRDIINKFLKVGANDFLLKPFQNDEVIVKLQSAIEYLDLFQEIRDLANSDYLTGAYNRRFFTDTGVGIIDKQRRKNIPVAVAMIDIDKFKNINDTFGHQFGDTVLKAMVNVFKKTLRRSDLFARIGGEEFAVLLEDVTQDDTVRILNNIREIFEKTGILSDQGHVYNTISIGMAYGSFSALKDGLICADKALYQAKVNGRNRLEIYTDSLSTHLIEGENSIEI